MDGRKKVLFLITKSNWGGAQRYVYDLATNLPRDQFEPVVAAGGNGLLMEKLRAAGVRTVSLPLERDVSVMRDIRGFQEIRRLILAERPDILHLNSSKAGTLGSLAGRLARIPRIIFTAHGWAFNNPRASLAGRILASFLHAVTILLAHTTIAVSEAVRTQIGFPFRHRMQLIRAGIANTGNAPFTREDLCSRADLINSDCIIGAIAELHPVKGLDDLIESARILRTSHPSATTVIFGSGEMEDELRARITSMGLVDRVILCGFDENAAQYLPAFDIFVQPSRSEALGYAVLEAGLAARAVVATRVGGIPEIVESGVSGILVPPHDANTLAGAIGKLCAETELRTRYGGALHERVRTEFSFNEMLEKTLALYLK